jgi:predicted O-linked N-acetylglucosamine transferase (SPINDLY family)
MLQQAIQAFQGGNLDSAELILKRVLQVDSKNLPALHILGLIKASQASYREAVDFLSKAARIQPKDPSIQYNLAKALSDCGLDKESVPHHKKAVELSPLNPEAWLNYGKTISNLSRHDEAMILYDRALSLEPSYAQAVLNKGAALKELGRYEEAIAFAERAIELSPNLAEGWMNKGAALQELKRYEEAIAHYDQALSLKPDYHEAWCIKGAALQELKLYEEAITHYDQALRLKPNYHEAWCNKGAALQELKRYEEAITHYDQALSLKPNYHEALYNKATALKEIKRYEEAIAHYDQALSLKPDYHEAWCNKGAALQELNRYEEAIAHYDQALSLKDDLDWLHGALVHAKMHICSWSGIADSCKNIVKKILASEKVAVPFALLALIDDASLHKKSAEKYVQEKYPFNLALGPIPPRTSSTKIRIGYFSADFKNHPVSILTAEMFELHDKNNYEIVAFSFGPDDEGSMRLRLRQAFDQFIDVGNMPEIEIAKLSRELKIDIAIDLGGHTLDSRTAIFSYRAAPVQISYIGYLGTMGAPYIDYILADKTLIPDELQRFYSEKIAYLPSYQANDRRRIASDRIFTRQELGLPEKGFVFCCFNSNYKILPATFDGWARILEAAEGSVLLLYAENQWAETNLKKEAEARGINSAKIVFGKRMSTEEYLARYRACDLFLDTFPYNAGATASDALWSGVPVLTLMGQSFASRIAASLLNAVGLPELITSTQKEYETLAIELAMNPQRLAGIKSKLIEGRLTTPLFDTPLFVKNLESTYMRMYERDQLGMQPDHLFIP